MRVRLVVDGHAFDVDIDRTSHGVRVEAEGERLDARTILNGASVRVEADGRVHAVELPDDRNARVDGRPVRFAIDAFRPGRPLRGGAGAGARVPVVAVMPGRLVQVLSKVGEGVRRGQPLFVLEAMKMQNELTSPADGRVAEVLVQPGDVVEAGRLLARLDPGAAP